MIYENSSVNCLSHRLEYTYTLIRKILMYAQSLIFLRFACYVHNPDAIYTQARTPVVNWLNEIQAQDSEWGYSIVSGGTSKQSVICMGVPDTMHHALTEFEADYTYTNPNVTLIKSILSAKRNTLRLTKHNIKRFITITKTTPAELVTVFESYLSRIEMNPMQPVTNEEILAIKSIGVDWRLASRLPRMDDGDFEKIFIVDEHHRVKCL